MKKFLNLFNKDKHSADGTCALDGQNLNLLKSSREQNNQQHKPTYPVQLVEPRFVLLCLGIVRAAKLKQQERQQLIPEYLIRLIFDYCLSGHRIKFNAACNYNTLYDPLGVITRQGGLFSWGRNQVGQLGFGTLSLKNYLTPKRMTYFDSAQISDLLSITSARSHQFFIVRSLKTGNIEIYATGLNTYGQLGTRPIRYHNKPKRVPFFNEIKGVSHIEIVAQPSHTFFVATLTNGTIQVYATGCNNHGQLGLGNHQDQITPTQITFFNHLENIRHIQIIAQAKHTFFVVTLTQGARKVYATGCNNYGQLGLGNHQDQVTPTQITFFNQVDHQAEKISHLQIVAQATHTFFVVTFTQGLIKVYATGLNNSAQLGVGDTQPRNTPTHIVFFNCIKDVRHIDISAQSNHTFFVVTLTQGSIGVYAVGYNGHGQMGLGNNRYVNQLTKVAFFSQLENIRHIEIVSQANHSFFVVKLAQGTIKVYGTGYNSHGQLGLGNLHYLSEPTQINFFNDLENIRHIEIAAQPSHTLFKVTFAHKATKVYGSGYNDHGQLGLGSLHLVRKPTEIHFQNKKARRLVEESEAIGIHSLS